MTEQERKLSEGLQKLQGPSFKEKLERQQVYNLIQRHRKTIQEFSDYDLSDKNEFDQHAILVRDIGNNYLAKEFRKFEIDPNNAKIIGFLIQFQAILQNGTLHPLWISYSRPRSEVSQRIFSNTHRRN